MLLFIREFDYSCFEWQQIFPALQDNLCILILGSLNSFLDI